mgnify:CR=1 FL=1
MGALPVGFERHAQKVEYVAKGLNVAALIAVNGADWNPGEWPVVLHTACNHFNFEFEAAFVTV